MLLPVTSSRSLRGPRDSKGLSTPKRDADPPPSRDGGGSAFLFSPAEYAAAAYSTSVATSATKAGSCGELHSLAEFIYNVCSSTASCPVDLIRRAVAQ